MTPTPSDDHTICRSCGADISAHHRFCVSCGTAVTASAHDPQREDRANDLGSERHPAEPASGASDDPFGLAPPPSHDVAHALVGKPALEEHGTGSPFAAPPSETARADPRIEIARDSDEDTPGLDMSTATDAGVPTEAASPLAHAHEETDAGQLPPPLNSPPKSPPVQAAAASYQPFAAPEPLSGALPLMVFGLLFCLVPFLPFASVNGQTDHEVVTSAVLQSLVLGGTAILAGVAGLRGSTAGLAAGAGVVTAWTVLLTLVAWFFKLMFIDLNDTPGVSVTPHVGFFNYVTLTILGIVVFVRALPAFKQMPGTVQAPPILGLVGLAGAAMWLGGTLRQMQLDARDSFGEFWSGEIWIDANFVALLAGTVIAGLVFAARPSSATGAYFFGYMTLPAVIWFADKVPVEWSTQGLTVRPSPEHALTTAGLIVSLATGLIATFFYACRRVTSSGYTSDQRQPANGAFIATAMVVGIAMAYGLAEQQNQEQQDMYDEQEDLFDDGF